MELLGQLNELEKSYEDFDDLECSPVHAELTKRMRKTLYAGRVETEGISLPLTVRSLSSRRKYMYHTQPQQPGISTSCWSPAWSRVAVGWHSISHPGFVADIVVELFENAEQGHLGQLSKRYVANLTRRSNATQCCLFLSMIYTKRLRESNPDYVTRIKPAELFLVSMMIATKFLYDEGEEEELYNEEWADAAKIDVNRVHDLEMEFLAAIDWKLLVDPLDFFEFLLGVETRIALSEGRKRGWFTYTDLSILMQHPAWYEACTTLLERMVKVISICMVVYSLCAATTIWSALLLHQTYIPSQPTNGCLPLPLSPHLAKSTEPHHIYNHLLLDLVLRFYLDHDPQMTAGSPMLRPEVPAFHCFVPWYELEQDLSRNGRFLWPSEEQVSRETAEGVVTDSCQCRSEQQSWETEMDHRLGEEGNEKCCARARSLSQRYLSLAAKMRRVQDALVMFYSALLMAWSEIPSASRPDLTMPCDYRPLTVCSDCRLQSITKLNSSKSASEEPEQVCCKTVSSSFDRQDPLMNERHYNTVESREVACTSCGGEEKLTPVLLSLDQNMGFRTSSEILVTM